MKARALPRVYRNKNNYTRGFPGGPVVKTPHLNTAEGTGSIPDRVTKIPHANKRKKERERDGWWKTG